MSGNPFKGEAYKGERKNAAFYRSTTKSRMHRNYKGHVGIVERVEQAKDHAELQALKVWFDSPQNQMSSKVEKKFCAAFRKRYEELNQQLSREHALRQLTNQT